MARTIHSRKRSRGVVLMRAVKRRRTVRRARRTRRFSGTTSRANAPTSIGRFRTRRISRKTFRRRLWNSTIDKSHYRSVRAVTTSVGSPNNLVDATLAIIVPGTDGANPFWTVGGGALPEDTGVAVPTFNGDITLRGGISRISIANRVSPTDAVPTDCCRVTVFTVWNNVDIPGFVFPTTVPISWDPSVFPDFQRNGRVISKKEAILEPGGQAMELFWRHRVQRIDQNVFNNNGGRLAYFVLVSQLTNTEAIGTPENVDIVTSWNLSFSADAQ